MYVYDTADELTSVTPPGLGAVSNTFDANGNETGRGSDTSTYDAQNRTTAATVGGTSSTMTYNGDGLRQSRNHRWYDHQLHLGRGPQSADAPR